MIDTVVYGKIVIDTIALPDGRRTSGVLGGGGPQAAFGARLWNDRVGLLSRAGDDLPVSLRADLADLDVSLEGLVYYPGIATPRGGVLDYDADQALTGTGAPGTAWLNAFTRLNAQPLPYPAAYARPRAIHLVVRTPDDPVVQYAQRLRAAGTIVSIEPLWEPGTQTDPTDATALAALADILVPDRPTTTNIAGTEDVADGLRFWSDRGAAIIAIRSGPRGSFIWSRRTGQAHHVPIVAVETLDPTGAGNAYGGAFAAALVAESDPVLAAVKASVAASFVVEQIGTPTRPSTLRQPALDRIRALSTAVAPLSTATTYESILTSERQRADD